METLQTLLNDLSASPELLGLAGLGLGVLVVVYGLSGTLATESPKSRRMRAGAVTVAHGADFDLIRGDNSDPHGLLKAFVPTSQQERTKVARLLRQAGLKRKNAVRAYYAFRTVMGIILPIAFVAAMALPLDTKMRLGIDGLLHGITWFNTLQIVTALMVAGFYGPSLWLRARIKARRQAIEHGLPNALDLLQVAIEAGLGFDAAMVRVSHELAHVSPEISQEFMILQLELQAGKDRHAAFLDMADRVGVDEVAAFANVILQSSQFGTSVSTALNRFAKDMRQDRELKAQEKANRLPVQMSAVMALCMMPVLLMICLAPVLIRWMNMYG